MTLCQRSVKNAGHRFLVSKYCHPQTVEVVRARALPLGIEVVEFDERSEWRDWTGVFGVLVQYPATDGIVYPFQELIDTAHAHQAMVVMATDLWH